MKPHIAKAVLIGVDLDDPYSQRKMIIFSFEGTFAVESAYRAKSQFDDSKEYYPLRHFSVIANEAAWYLWNDQQPHLSEKQ